MICLVEHEWDKSDFRLARLCEWAGFSQSALGRCDITSGLSKYPPASVYMPLGERATAHMGVTQPVLTSRGYVWEIDGKRIIPSVSPKFIQKGMAKYSAAFINDLQKAGRIDREGMPPQITSYLLDPYPLAALQWAEEYRRHLGNDPGLYLAFDIETPGKGDEEDDLDLDSDAPDRTWNIDRIGFSYRGFSALSIPWAPEYLAAIRLLLGSSGPKVVWNAGFDVPRVRRASVNISGIIHDGMVAWHILHSDLPKRLGFVATFTCPFQLAWKHLSGARPAFYNATDADVELRSMITIEKELIASNLWDVYQKDVLDLEPILVHMHEMGMPVDAEIRLDRAIKLQDAIGGAKEAMRAAVPLAARRIAHAYINTPSNTEGLHSRDGVRRTTRCAHCGLLKPRKDHFKRYVKKVNPCVDAGIEEISVSVTEWYRLADFTPSRDQLIRYHNHLGRALPKVYDKRTRSQKVSFGERQLKELTGLYPNDVLYSSILEFRKLDKLAGTYIGRPSE